MDGDRLGVLELFGCGVQERPGQFGPIVAVDGGDLGFDFLANTFDDLATGVETLLFGLEFRTRELLLTLLVDRPFGLPFGRLSYLFGVAFGLGDDLLGALFALRADLLRTRAGFVSDVLYDRIKTHCLENCVRFTA